MGAVLDPSEEVVVYTDSVIHPVLTGKKAFLGRVDQGRDRWHYDVSHSGGEDAVVGVGNADGPSVRNKPRVLLGNEEKKPVIEPRGGMVTPAKLGEDVEEEGSGKVCGSTPGSEGNTVRARSRVIGAFDRLNNGLKGWVEELIVVDPFRVVTKKVGTLGT